MRIGIVEAIDPESLLLGKAQQFGILKNDVALLFPRHHNRAERQQTVFNLAHHIFRHQRIALARPDGRGINDMGRTVPGQRIDDHIQRFHPAYHTNLHNIRLHIVHDSLNLPRNNLGRNIEELLNTERILHSDAGYCRNSITAQLGNRPDVRLHTRASGAV